MLPSLSNSLKDSSIGPGTKCSFWEEVQGQDIIMIDPLNENAKFKDAQLDNGDIIVIQEQLTEVHFLHKDSLITKTFLGGISGGLSNCYNCNPPDA